MHKIKDYKAIVVGDYIKIKRYKDLVEVVEIFNNVACTIRVEIEDDNGFIINHIIGRFEYEYTEVCSKTYKANQDKLTDDGFLDWATCEEVYGINHHGLEDPDPLRQVAFAILRGDPQALDLARDVIDRGK